MCSDLLEWQPTRRYDVWHDRAAFHFLTEPADRRHYGAALASAISPGGIVVIATFALDGPLMCSGLPVVRYDGPAIEAELGDGFELITSRPEEHHTPSGGSQAFTWTVLRAV